MSSSSASSGGGGGGTVGAVNTSGSASTQAADMTRNFLLGIPKEGLAQGSEEAAQLQAAEAFVSDIQQEILAYDIANAKAMEAYATRWWSRVPFFGRHAKRALEEEEEQQQHEEKVRSATATSSSSSSYGVQTPKEMEKKDGHGGFRLTAEEAAQAAAAGGSVYMHRQSSTTTQGHRVERTSALDPAKLDEFHASSAGSHPPKMKVARAQRNSWLFRRQHPGWVPLMQRWWVPWVCVGAIGVIWTPDVWKLRALYLCDHQYALFRQQVHKAYWRMTMSSEDYKQLIADIESGSMTSTVKATDCPF